MDINGFYNLVKSMSDYQKTYFNTRGTDALKNAKKLEQQVNTILAKSIDDPTLETMNINVSDFYYSVNDMRDAQRKYFNTRDNDVLKLAKQLERKVDAIIKNGIHPPSLEIQFL